MNTKNGTYYKMHYIANGAFNRFQFMSYGDQESLIGDLLTLRRLAKRHHKLAEMDCNGAGVIRGVRYYIGMGFGEKPDAYEVREYGYGVKSAYLSKDNEKTVFDAESEKVEAKIGAICERLGLRVEFQGDPRGYTVRVFKGDRFLDMQA